MMCERYCYSKNIDLYNEKTSTSISRCRGL
nr:MAG TPA: hypothetical protein [Caudoviricetes sp.]